MPTVELKINNFSGGVSDDIRQENQGVFGITQHFDIHQNPGRLVPYRAFEADDTDVKTSFVRDFVYASASAKLYGLGQTGAGLTKIVYKADATTGAWTLPASSEGNGAVKNGCFFEFKDYLWGFQGTNQFWKWGTLSGTPSITNSVATVGSTITSVANGIIDPNTGDAYVAYNNVVVRISPALAVTDSAKTVPTNFKIISLTPWGKYISINCAPVASYNGVSKSFIWDGSSTDAFVDIINWGEGDLRVCDDVEGYLIAVTDRYLNNSAGAGKGAMVIQTYSQGVPQVVKEVFTKALTGKTIPTTSFKRNNRLFWSAKIMSNTSGTEYVEGVWSFGRKNANYPWALTCDYSDSTIDTDGIQAIGNAANFIFLAHSNDGSIAKTDDTTSYTETSIYESQIFNFGAYENEKRLEHIKVLFSPITSGQTLTVKMKVDDDTSWTTIGTFNTVGEVARQFTGLTGTVAFPTGKEMQFRLESVGGLEIVGFELKANILN